MNLFTRYSVVYGLLILFPSGMLRSEVSLQDFSKVNGALITTHQPLVLKKYQSTMDLKEYYGDYGGAFKVDSARKPLGESRFVITLTGKTAQIDRMNMDGYAIVACHELGHVLGGYPLQKNAIDSWSSVEGQADWYATNQCMWTYVKIVNATTLIRDFDRDFIARCDQAFHGDLEKIMGCLRIISGVQAMADYFNRSLPVDKKVSLFAKDSRVVEKTLQRYPSDQCRVDTYMAGLFNSPRPRCWFSE